MSATHPADKPSFDQLEWQYQRSNALSTIPSADVTDALCGIEDELLSALQMGDAALFGRLAWAAANHQLDLTADVRCNVVDERESMESIAAQIFADFLAERDRAWRNRKAMVPVLAVAHDEGQAARFGVRA